MTSRTTKQAARAYQKAHGIPYTEALRRVMETETPPAEASPYEHITGDIGVGKGSRAEGSGRGPVVGKLIKSEPGPVRIDPMTWLDTAEQFDKENSDVPQIAVTGQLGSGSTIGARSRQSISLGVANTTRISSLFDRYDPIPVSWSPWRAKLQGSPPNLGVYGPHGHGKTVFLSTIANRYKHTMPITVVTAYPDAYPTEEGKLKIVDEIPDGFFTDLQGKQTGQALETAEDWAEEVDPDNSTSDRLPLLLIDLQPADEEALEGLRQLLKAAFQHGVGVFYTGPGEHGPHPALRPLTDIALTLHRQKGNWVWRDRETPLELLETFPSEEPFTGRN